MREALARLNDQRIALRAVIRRHGQFNRLHTGRFPTVLLGDVRLLDGTALCDHCWIYLTKTLRELDLRPGDLLQCTARVRGYTKGYVGIDSLHKKRGEMDYTLEHLEQCVCLRRAARPAQEAVYESHESR